MDLSPEEVATRIKAARLLRGMSQRELAAQLAHEGLAQRVAAHLERGEGELTPVQRHALSEVLCLPERWFCDPLESLLPMDIPSSTSAERYAAVEDKLDQIIEAVCNGQR